MVCFAARAAVILEEHVMNRLSLLVCGAALMVVSAAEARPFRPLAVEAGGGLTGVDGNGFRASFGGLYNRAGTVTNNRIEPIDVSAWSESDTNHIAYDSYLTLAGNGPSRLSAGDDVGDSLSPQIRAFYGYTDTFASQIPQNYVVAPGSHIGVSGSTTGQPPYAAATPVDRARGAWGGQQSLPPNDTWLYSGINPRTGNEGAFIGQLTVSRGALITGGGQFSNLLQLGVYIDMTLVLDGPEVVAQYSPGVFKPFVMRSYLVASHDDLSHSRSGGNAGSGSGNTQRFGAADVYHLWIEVVPSPGPVMLFACAGVASVRRRRG